MAKGQMWVFVFLRRTAEEATLIGRPPRTHLLFLRLLQQKKPEDFSKVDKFEFFSVIISDSSLN